MSEMLMFYFDLYRKVNASRSKLKLKRGNGSASESPHAGSGKASTKSIPARQVGAKCGQSPKEQFRCLPKTPKTWKGPRTPTKRRENSGSEERLRAVRGNMSCLVSLYINTYINIVSVKFSSLAKGNI